jgi:hypothetical protein
MITGPMGEYQEGKEIIKFQVDIMKVERRKSLFKEIIIENYPRLEKVINIQVEKDQKITRQIKPKEDYSKNIIIRHSKLKDSEKT